MHKLQAFGQALGQPSSSQAPAPAAVAAPAPAPAADPAAKRRRVEQDPSALLAAASRVLEVSSALGRAPRAEADAVVLSDDVVGLLLQRGLSAAIEHAAATKAQSMLQEAAAAMASEAVLAAAQRAVAGSAASLEQRAASGGEAQHWRLLLCGWPWPGWQLVAGS
jgi:pyruvate dehydrogenase E2 component (dihydrolipoamide acetyltransferase)